MSNIIIVILAAIGLDQLNIDMDQYSTWIIGVSTLAVTVDTMRVLEWIKPKD